jgi:hypothetical protein
VQVAQHWILARLRNQTFFSLEELNDRIAELLEELNTRVMVRYKASRRDLYERLEKPLLRPLRTDHFVYGKWKKARVNIDYHVVYDDHFYSAPYQLQGHEVWIRATALTIEIYDDEKRVGSHLRSHHRGRCRQAGRQADYAVPRCDRQAASSVRANEGQMPRPPGTVTITQPLP